MTKSELRNHLINGGRLDAVFTFGSGQECEIFKADKFQSSDEIIYIPDIWLNEIPITSPITEEEIMDDVIGCCYTGNDFIHECDGDAKLAERLFWYCDWQHPCSALPELEGGDEPALSQQRLAGVGQAAIDAYGETLNGRALYDALADSLRLNDEEILALGFDSLRKFICMKCCCEKRNAIKVHCKISLLFP